jgi:predicted dienelactone hydrolase
MATVWYPAERVPGAMPAQHSDPALRKPSICIASSSRGVPSHAFFEAPLSRAEPKYPLVIYSHGDQGTRTDNTRRVENLASFGFIVVGVDHLNCYATVFPDGQIFKGVGIRGQGPGGQIVLEVATNRAADMRFLLDEVDRWNTSDPRLKGHLDLNRTGIFGMSFGGGTSAAACAEEPRIKAGLSLDGGFHFFPIPAFKRPFLIISGGDTNKFMQQFRDAYRELFGRLTNDAFWVHLKDSTHCDFNDKPWFDTPNSETVTRRALVQDFYVVSFFRKYLRGEDDHFLDSLPADWPEVDVFQKR